MAYANKEEGKAYQKAYRESHKEEMRVYQKAYHEANKEKIRASSKVRHEANREERNIKAMANYEANKEERNIYGKAYYQAHKEKYKANKKVYYEVYKEEYSVYGKAYHKANPEKTRNKWRRRRAKKASVISLPIRTNFETFLIEVWENKCAYCRQTSDKWHQDHFVPLELKGHHAEYNLVLSCPSCNLHKAAKHPQIWLNEMKISFIYPDYMLKNVL